MSRTFISIMLTATLIQARSSDPSGENHHTKSSNPINIKSNSEPPNSTIRIDFLLALVRRNILQ